jgi:hypothetical protein
MAASMNGVGDGHGEESRTDLDSHANMPVVGGGAHVLLDHNKTCELSPDSPDYEPMEVPLVDAAVRYERDGSVYILLIRNALYVPSLDHNLLTPFKDYFYMDTFFANKKGGKSSRGHTCCQLFVTDKGFGYAVPRKRKGEVLLAMKQFAKEIGAPHAFVADMSGEQISKEVKAFCNEIGSTLRALEEGTPWANKAELYIGLLKEAVRKDMKDQYSPMVFWDYCIERRARIHSMTAKSNFKTHTR